MTRVIDSGGLAHDQVYRRLRGQLMHGEVAAGAGMTLRGIGAQFNVSMTPAREAARRLVAEGGLSMSASGRLSAPALSNERIEELASLRALLEPELASRALPRAHLALIERLEAINIKVGQAARQGRPTEYIRTNLEFHRALYLRAQAPAILALTETVWLQMGPTMGKLYGRLQRTAPPHYHRLIIEALKAGDEPGLRLAVRSDVTTGLRMLKT